MCCPSQRKVKWDIALEVRAGVAEDDVPDGWTMVIYSGHDVAHAQLHEIPRYASENPIFRGEIQSLSSDLAWTRTRHDDHSRRRDHPRGRGNIWGGAGVGDSSGPRAGLKH